MKKLVTLFLLLSLYVAPVHGEEHNPKPVQSEVWERYLPAADVAALTKMLPARNADATSPAKSVQDSINASRDGFVLMAQDYARMFSDIPTAPYDANGIRGSWLTPKNADSDKVLLYLHGGAYVFGSDVTPKAITAFLAKEANIRCFSLDYPLAPEHPFSSSGGQCGAGIPDAS